jgi:sugar phosphate isomerase/epimerase
MTKFSLAHLSLLDLNPPELIMTAAEAGYVYVGLRLVPVTPGGAAWALFDDPAMMAMTKARMAETGVGVLDVELARLEPGTDVQRFKPYFEVAAELGSHHVLTQVDDPVFSRAADNYAALCDLAATYDLICDIEFIPWQVTNSLARAAALLNAAARPNVGIMIDSLHFDRAGVELDEIGQYPAEWFRYIQLCDAPRRKPADLHGLLYAAREERLFPGEGELDLLGVLARLPRDLPVALEIPTETLSFTESPEARARLAREAAQRVLTQAGWS